jgi:hypothetical protein
MDPRASDGSEGSIPLRFRHLDSLRWSIRFAGLLWGVHRRQPRDARRHGLVDYKRQQFREEDGWHVTCHSDQEWDSRHAYQLGERAP